MKKKIEFTVTANSCAYGCATKSVYLPEYNGDPEAFQHDILVQVLCVGYQSILHYNDELGLLMCCYTTHKRLFEEILWHIEKHHWANNALEALTTIEGASTDEEREAIIKEAERCGVGDVKYNEQWKCWHIAHHTKDTLERQAGEYAQWLRNCMEILQLAGFDPEQRERIRRQCENMGMYRV